jgi:uncharacterized ferritin-like protein (DUF455 family)
MDLTEYSRQLLEGKSLEEKLLSPKSILDFSACDPIQIKTPARDVRLKFSDKQIKFPKKSQFHLDEKKGLALHFFANHELLAIEMLAQAILLYSQEMDEIVLKGILKTIEDEQKHLNLYLLRMKDFKIEFGDYPLNDFFWRQAAKAKSLAEFYSLMALTFEQANLDFALYYKGIFEEVEDHKSSELMKIIYEDEIVHVARGVNFLKQSCNEENLWNYYQKNLPENVSPARAKGIIFDVNSRKKAGLSENFIQSLKNYRNDFSIVERKEWKK